MLVNAALRNAACRSRSVAMLSVLPGATAHRHFSTNTTKTLASASGVGTRGPPSGTPTAPTPATASMSQGYRRESRFTRPHAAGGEDTSGSSSAQHATSAVDGANASGTATPSLSLAAQIAQVTLQGDTRFHRPLLHYLQRVQSVLRRSQHPAVAAIARAELQKIFLPAIKGVDAPTMTVLLQTLRLADVSDDAPILHDAVAWLSLYGLHTPLPQLTKAVELLHYFHVPLAGDCVRTLPQRLSPQDVSTLTAAQAVTLLTALLPCLRYPVFTTGDADGAVNERGSNWESAVGTPADRALVELAELLRERCKGAEFVACEPALTAELLRGLLAFQASSEWRLVQNQAAWTSLQGTMCAILATSAHVEAMDLSNTVRLLDTLLRHCSLQAQQQQRQSSDGDTTTAAESTAQAEERLASALAARLHAALQVLDSTPVSASAELPAPWGFRDVREVWRMCLQHTSDTAPEQQQPTPPYNDLWTRGKDILLTYVMKFFAAHVTDVGAAEMAFAVARGIATADRAAAHRAQESQPTTGSDASAPTATPDPSLTSLPDILPPPLLDTLVHSTSEQLRVNVVTWTPTTVLDAVAVFEGSSDAAHRQLALDLAQCWYKQLQGRAQEGARLLPQELLGFFTGELLRKERVGVEAAVTTSMRRWSVSEVLYFFTRLATTASTAETSSEVEAAAVLRQVSAVLCNYVSKASAAQLAALVECYGLARVRNDDFCETAMRRLAELLDVSLTAAARHVDFSTVSGAGEGGSAAVKGVTDGEDYGSGASTSPNRSSDRDDTVEAREVPAKSTSPVTLSQLTRILRSFALMEVRQPRPFIDAAPHVTLAASEDQGSAADITQLLAAYGKMLIWNYPVYRALAERLCRMRRDDVRLSDLVTAQLALLRMDLTLPAVTERFYEALTAQYGATSDDAKAHCAAAVRVAEPPLSPRAALNDAVMQLSVLSRLRGRTPVTPADPSVTTALVAFILQRAELLQTDELAEVLLSLARLNEGHSDAFAKLTVRALGLLPTAPPRVMAHIAEAYAVAGRGDEAELFTLIAERTIALRHDIAAITIASILAAFAQAGVRNDRLFIEVIPRVRHVAVYGTPRDVVNVVGAYASVNLWHYKLFARLADRAIQLRADFRVAELVRLLQAYAAVQMRYDVLFTEFAPRVQTLAHLLSPADLAAVVSSYSRLSIPCAPVWKATAARAVAVADAFTEAEAEQLLDAYSTQGFYDAECVQTLTARFPALASIPFETSEVQDATSAGDKASE